jgi:hypothetical protein
MGRHHDTARAGARPPDHRPDGTSAIPTPAIRAHRRRARALAVVASAALTLAACGGDDDEAGTQAALDAAATAEAATAEESGGDAIAIGATAATTPPVTAADGAVIEPGGIAIGAIGRDVIVEMQISMSSDDVQRAVATITARASALGGGVASSNVDYGDPNAPETASAFATLVVKVPPDRVEELIGGLDDSGTVRSITQSAQDVTDQLVDLDVRIANARQSVTNVREFMDRTEDLTELVTLESELTRRQTELEQLEAQQRNLSDRVALSTVTIGIVSSAAVPVPEPDRDGIGGAFAEGWSAFVALLYGVLVVLAVLMPFIVTGAVIAAAAWWVLRRRATSRGAQPARDVGDTSDVSGHDDVPTPTG